MIDFRRRSFLGLMAASAIPAHARKLQTVGVQLYTLRRVLPKDPLEILRAVEKMGYREVEVTQDDMEKIWPSLKQTSLRPVSLHMATDLFTKEQAKLPAALQIAKQHGFEYVVCPWIEPKDRGGIDVMRRLGDSLNKAGEMCRKAGLRLCYHNHAFEFAPAERRTLLDVLMDAADPKLVSLELDIMWARVAGVDPAAVLVRFGSRIPLVHLKSIARGFGRRFDENLPSKAFQDLAHGVIDLVPVLKAAAQAGVKHYFVEQDETPGNPIDSLRASYQHLQTLDF